MLVSNDLETDTLEEIKLIGINIFSFIFTTVAIDLIVQHIRDFLNNIRYNGNENKINTTQLARLHWIKGHF